MRVRASAFLPEGLEDPLYFESRHSPPAQRLFWLGTRPCSSFTSFLATSPAPIRHTFYQHHRSRGTIGGGTGPLASSAELAEMYVIFLLESPLRRVVGLSVPRPFASVNRRVSRRIIVLTQEVSRTIRPGVFSELAYSRGCRNPADRRTV